MNSPGVEQMKKNTLLVVEDEVLVAKDISARLTQMGYEVVGTAGKGKDAIARALSLRPDLILMDIHLRDQIDGITAAQEINKTYDVPVIFCTAYSNNDTLERAKISAPYGYILKPFDNRELEINIEIALYKHRAERALRETEQHLDTTLRNINDGVVATDRMGRVSIVNSVAENLVGVTASETQGMPIGQLLELKDFETGVHNVDLRSTVLEQGEDLWNVRQYLVRRNGSEVPVEISANLIRDNETDTNAIGMVISLRDISQQIGYERQIQHNAFYDTLTSLPNRTLFLDRVGHAIDRTRQSSDYRFAVLFIDLDNFRVINEGLGHSAGDALIVDVSHRISEAIGHADTLSRFSGDIFAVVLDDIASLQSVIESCNKIKKAFATPFSVNHRHIEISGTIGIVLNNGNYRQPEEMIRDADTAVHRAKREAKGGYLVFDTQMHANALRYIEWREEMQQAIDAQKFEVYYQPIISAETGHVASMEALLRWKSDKYGYVSPADFIPIAEESGLIVQIGEWVLRSVCKQIASWQLELGLQVRVSVNLSAVQFEQKNLTQMITSALSESGISPKLLGLEITEGVAMRDIELTINILEQLQQQGMPISIDDFGTGYSSLAYLKRFPIDTLKIDRSFVTEITESKNDQAIAQAIVALAQSMGLNVLAEGVETNEQLDFLIANGCEFIQGHYYSPALPAAAASQYLCRDKPIKKTGT